MNTISLELFRNDLQTIADWLATSLNLEITISDENNVRIVGTGAFKKKVFQEIPAGSIYRTAIANSKPILIEKTAINGHCKNCESRSQCNVLASACAPIIVGGKLLGVIGILALNESQEATFLQKASVYYDSMLKLADLVKTVLEIAENGQVQKARNDIIDFYENSNFDAIIGKSSKLNESITLAKTASKTNANVLIFGETGTGKELFAKAIHQNSDQKNGPFVPINCSAIPDNLLESELFGYEDGAFTGARKGGKIGKFEFATNGTIFLDEIGEMPFNMQAKLLRVLEDKQIVRLGGIRSTKINVRIISATCQNPRLLIKEGKFREDLFYRLNLFPISLPPLRDHVEDLDQLANAFLKKYARLYKKSISKLQPELLNCLYRHKWPGNIRELENIIEYGVCVETTSVLREKTILSRLEENIDDKPGTPMAMTLSDTVKYFEKQHIKDTLENFKGDPLRIHKAARALGISKATLYRKLNWKFGKKYKDI